MTKARDLSNIISGGFTADDIPNLDASKITTGEIANARVADLPASKITSGTFANDRISESSVSQHATSFDDNAIVNDISTLALRQASDQDKSAYNTNSQFVDVFQDSTGIDTTTNASRNTNEYVSSTTTGALSKLDWFTPTPSTYQIRGVGIGNANYTDVTNSLYISTVDVDTANTTSEGGAWGHSGGNTGTIEFYADFKEPKTFSDTMKLGKNNNYGDIKEVNFAYSLDGSTWTSPDLSSIVQSGATNYGTSGAPSGGGLQTSSGTSSGNFIFNQNNTGYTHLSTFTATGFPTFTARYFRFQKVSLWASANNNVGGIYFTPYILPITTSATGNFTGTTITAPSSVSSMGAIITYQDQAGTNALNTDIVLELSADNGSNWSTATLSALPNFSTGIKMAKVNDLAVTAGTQLKYRLNFANQSSGSKDARIRGVALQY